MQILALLSMLAMFPAQPAEVSYDDMLWLARAVQGEVGVMGEHRAETGAWVVHVALNRVPNKWFPGTIEQVVRQGFAGAHVIPHPDPWAWEVAQVAVLQHQVSDPTSGALFIFGSIDINNCIDWSSHTGSAQRDGWLFGVHMFSRWPYIKECEPW